MSESKKISNPFEELLAKMGKPITVTHIQVRLSVLGNYVTDKSLENLFKGL